MCKCNDKNKTIKLTCKTRALVTIENRKTFDIVTVKTITINANMCICNGKTCKKKQRQNMRNYNDNFVHWFSHDDGHEHCSYYPEVASEAHECEIRLIAILPDICA